MAWANCLKAALVKKPFLYKIKAESYPQMEIVRRGLKEISGENT